jgi:hypothetical protein
MAYKNKKKQKAHVREIHKSLKSARKARKKTQFLENIKKGIFDPKYDD